MQDNINNYPSYKKSKEYTSIRRFYAWVGFVVVWLVFGSIVASLLIGTDRTITLLVNIFG